MILRNIRMENFGLYAGTTDFDLVPRRRRNGLSPIILIGGRNGAGKTTLLEAVRLALYGRRALGVRVGATDYESYLKGRINRGSDKSAAAVALEFDYAEAGIIHRYRVRREWVVKGRSVIESLSLDRNGEIVTSVPREEWHQFLQELIPPGVSQLFFFDGEKIREIADGEDESDQLAEAVRSLLGIDLVGRLRTDLGLYIARNQSEGDETVAARLEATIRDIGISKQKATSLADEIAELTSVRDSQARAAEQIRRRFVAEGGDAAVHRARIEAEADDVQRSIDRAEQEFRDLSSKLLPFAVAPKLLNSFRVALDRAGAGGEQRTSMLAARAAIEVWRKDKESARSAIWSKKHWTDLTQFLDTQVSSSAKSKVCPAFREVGDGAVALSRLREIETFVRPRASMLLEQLDGLAHRDRELQSALTRADNAASGHMLDELRLADQQVGAMEATLKTRQEELKTVRGQLVTMERERRRLLEEQAGTAVSADRAALAARTSQALAEYEHRLLEHKLSQLRAEFVKRFNQLARKDDLVADVRINPETFAATLIDRKGNEVPKSDLSAGEKQVYAIAMLWALAKTSGRPLPMIIDTPLARLDTEHRANLIERYFPAASHQVILLSTDTEIDNRLLTDLGTTVSHTYRLDYDPIIGRTIASPGYFEASSGAKEGVHELQQA
jgi:DNA sulfur modification protein DndD